MLTSLGNSGWKMEVVDNSIPPLSHSIETNISDDGTIEHPSTGALLSMLDQYMQESSNAVDSSKSVNLLQHKGTATRDQDTPPLVINMDTGADLMAEEFMTQFPNTIFSHDDEMSGTANDFDVYYSDTDSSNSVPQDTVDQETVKRLKRKTKTELINIICSHQAEIDKFKGMQNDLEVQLYNHKLLISMNEHTMLTADAKEEQQKLEITHLSFKMQLAQSMWKQLEAEFKTARTFIEKQHYQLHSLLQQNAMLKKQIKSNKTADT